MEIFYSIRTMRCHTVKNILKHILENITKDYQQIFNHMNQDNNNKKFKNIINSDKYKMIKNKKKAITRILNRNKRSVRKLKI